MTSPIYFSLINKYVRLLYRDEKEDVYAEFMKALWEAMLDIKYYNNDGQVIRFISTAMKNKYLELYRASRRYHDNMVGLDDEMEITMDADNTYDDILLQESSVPCPKEPSTVAPHSN